MKVINFILDYWPLIGSLLYEICVRLWPTEKNRSLIDNIWKIFNQIIPNVRKRDGKETIVVTENGAPTLKNYVKASLDRHVLKSIILLLFISNVATAQIWQNFKGIRLVNQLDSTQVLAVDGSIYYNEQSKKFRCMENGVWKDCIPASSGGGSYTASEGVTLSGTNLTWGGSITTPRNITSNNGSNITFGGGSYATNIGTFTTNTRGGRLFTAVNSGGNYTTTETVTSNSYDLKVSADDGSATVKIQAGNNIDGGELILSNGDYYSDNAVNYIYLDGNAGGTYVGAHNLASSVGSSLAMNSSSSSWSANSGANYTRIDINSSNGTLTSVNGVNVSTIRNDALSGVEIETSNINVDYLAGSGTRMVTVSATGDISAQAIPGGGGITNNASINEIPKTIDGSGNLSSTEVFSSTNGTITLGSNANANTRRIIVDGNGTTALSLDNTTGGVIALNVGTTELGSGTMSGPRSINVQSSDANASLALRSKGTAGIHLMTYSAPGAIELKNTANTNGFRFFPHSTDPIFESIKSTTHTMVIRAGAVVAGQTTGSSLLLQATDGDTSITSDGGNITIQPGSGSMGGSDGYIIMPVLPTSCAGAPSGALWNDNNVLSICP